MRPLLVSVLILLASGPGCSRQAPLPVLLTPQTRLGLGDGFGPGIVTATPRAMTYQLDTPAHVIVLRVLDDGSIEPLRPVGRGDRALQRGSYSVVATARPAYAPRLPHVPSGLVYGPCVSAFDADLAKPDPACWTADRATAGPEPQPAPVRQREHDAGYWLVIVSDAATQPVELDARLRALVLDENATLLDNVRLIPSALVGGRTTNWNAYYVGFAVIPARAR